jgi:hypothetical protein
VAQAPIADDAHAGAEAAQLAGATLFCGGFAFEASRAERILRAMFPPPAQLPYR